MNAIDKEVQASITQLWVYPVKSCAGIALERAKLCASGLAWDRSFMLVDAQGEFLTQRSHARMALIRPELEAEHLVLHFAGQAPLRVALQARGPERRVRVWSDWVDAWDMGPEPARWLSQALGTDCALVRFDPARPRQASRRWCGEEHAPVQFADGYPLLVLSQASVDELNQRLQAQGHEAVTALRFRPNIVLGELQAHDEDRVDAFEFAELAGLSLRLVKPCTRCPIPDIDPATALAGTAVSQAMAAYRQDERVGGAITFGMNALVLGLDAGAAEQGLEIALGQRLGADWSFG
ncbi:MOSC domain-containing protein [Comamonas composti]|uniref:MOSC domain-containing protein n=1 Tax=Comamonas composti TaxID=408558 RepID=UPI0003FD3B90|nr:MOSC N-terminal beta barrel domain-containing protein [Comamonas composti]